jgi:HAD superfamily hydrolase (TIGR01509 family)
MPIEVTSKFYSAVFFDMDGLLIDSEPLWLEAETEMMANFGYQWQVSDQALCLGGPLDRVGEYMSQCINGKKSGELLKLEIINRMVEKFSGQLPLMPGAAELIRQLQEHGIELTLVSASPRLLVDAALSKFSTTPFTKPDPEGYLAAANHGGHEISDCLIFEDSLTGVTAASASGASVIAVPHLVPITATAQVQVSKSLADWNYQKLALKYELGRSA